MGGVGWKIIENFLVGGEGGSYVLDRNVGLREEGIDKFFFCVGYV